MIFSYDGAPPDAPRLTDDIDDMEMIYPEVEEDDDATDQHEATRIGD